ncbi:MAG TPA: hypothetical protein DDW65_14300 [Firmicutes bacterium]|jgi:hypothetical protein|nr:hypothetical protein [Bacillota bacterium]
MAECINLATCPFFNDKMSSMPVTANILKKRLCQTDNTNCARFMVFQALGKGNVPSNLFPHQIEDVQEIINKAKSATGQA